MLFGHTYPTKAQSLADAEKAVLDKVDAFLFGECGDGTRLLIHGVEVYVITGTADISRAIINKGLDDGLYNCGYFSYPRAANFEIHYTPVTGTKGGIWGKTNVYRLMYYKGSPLQFAPQIADAYIKAHNAATGY